MDCLEKSSCAIHKQAAEDFSGAVMHCDMDHHSLHGMDDDSSSDDDSTSTAAVGPTDPLRANCVDLCASCFLRIAGK